MIEFKDLSFGYTSNEFVIENANLKIFKGEFVLVYGPTGSGKSTFLKMMNGLAPHFTGGALRGNLLIEGVDVTGSKPHELAHLVGYVNQQPESAFVTDTVEEELAYGMEQLGFAVNDMAERVAKIAHRLGLTKLLHQPLANLSGGMQQRVSIGAAIAAGQQIILLDEPLSALDPATALKTIALLHELCREYGLTVVLAEHRIGNIRNSADSVIFVNPDGSVHKLLKDDLPTLPPPMVYKSPITTAVEVVLPLHDLSVKFGDILALKPVSFDLTTNSVIGVLGENGSGKTSLLWAVLNEAWAKTIAVAMVPQAASDLLFLNSLAAELAESDHCAQKLSGSTSALLTKLIGTVASETHPRDLSLGQQLALALAVQLVKGAELILLDEPTRGLDATAKTALAQIINNLRDEGKALLIASHDIDFITSVADQIMVLDTGELIASGSAEEILGSRESDKNA